MSYVDGFVIPVPKARLDEYRKQAALGAQVWLEHGAIGYWETIADDVPHGELTSFPRAVMAKDDEVVVFSWAVYPDRAARDATMKKVMEDPRLTGSMDKMPFDAKRMIFGGFQAFIER